MQNNEIQAAPSADGKTDDEQAKQSQCHVRYDDTDQGRIAIIQPFPKQSQWKHNHSEYEVNHEGEWS